MTIMRKSANAARMTKIHAQPMVVATSPPIVGANSGDTLSTSINSESILALSRAGKKSRTMAMAPTCATQPPSACNSRKAMNSSGERTAMQPSEAATNRLKPA